MRRAICAIAAVAMCLVAAQGLFAQGIESTILNLPLNGNWSHASDVERDAGAPGTQMFYDAATGTVVEMRNDYEIRAVNDISQQFKNAGQGGTTTEAAKILMMSMFPLPSKYSQLIASSIHEGHVPKMWEVRDPGNMQWFYVSQLFGGYHVSGGSNSSEIREEYLPMHVVLAEHKSAGRGDALIFEAETDRPAPEAAIKRFKMPASLKDQKLRYGWIQFSPGGINSSESIISLGFATPVSSGIDVNAVLDQMVKSYNTRAEVKN